MSSSKSTAQRTTQSLIVVAVLLVLLPAILFVSPIFLVPTVFNPMFQCNGNESSQQNEPTSYKEYSIPTNAPNPTAAAIDEYIEYICQNNKFGYSQAHRDGHPDYDCSSLVFYAVEYAGINVGTTPFVTQNMGQFLTRAGFEHLTWSGIASQAPQQLKPGDIIVNPTKHTEVYLGDGLFGGAHKAYPPSQRAKDISITKGIIGGLIQVYRWAKNNPVNPPLANVPNIPNSQDVSGLSKDKVKAGESSSTTDSSQWTGCYTSNSPAFNNSPEKENPNIINAPVANSPSAKQAQDIAMGMFGDYFPDNNTQEQKTCLLKLWTKESDWRWNAGSPGAAYGIPQSLPSWKMRSAGPDYLTNATTQIKWGLGYIKRRYKTPCAAWDHEMSTCGSRLGCWY